MAALFNRLYCLDISDVLLLCLLGTLLFFLLKKAWVGYPGWKAFVAAILLAWAAAAVTATVLQRNSDGGGVILIPFHSYWETIQGGNRERLRSNLMNAVLFYPPGLFAWELLPVKLRPRTRFCIVLLAALVMSVSIECLQYLGNLGLAETDDVIHNTLGTALAAGVCLVRSGGNKS